MKIKRPLRTTPDQLLSNIRANVGMSPAKVKTSFQLERHLKGVANHRRIEILMFVSKQPGASVDEISEALDCNFKVISVHTQKLVYAGLLEKKYLGRTVNHSLSPYGKKVYQFIKTF